METAELFESKPRKVTYNGGEAIYTTLGKTKSAANGTGLRMVVLTWKDSGTIDIKICKGDGRMVNFKEFLKIENATPEQVEGAKAMLCKLIDSRA